MISHSSPSPERTTELSGLIGEPLRGSANGRPVSVVLVDDYEIIVRGLNAMLAPYSHRVRVVDHEIGSTPDCGADVALFDTFAGRREALDRAERMLAERRVRHVVLYTWDAAAEFLEIARSIGVSAVVLKSTGAAQLVDILERVVAGERIGLDHVAKGLRQSNSEQLSTREREVLALIALGHTNGEIAEQLFLSVDTVKTYVRRLFAKLGVSNRTQAALMAAGQSVAPPGRRAPHAVSHGYSGGNGHGHPEYGE